MPDLEYFLKNLDVGHQHIIAEKWNFNFHTYKDDGIQALLKFMLDESQIKEIISDLPTNARSALNDLIINGGKIPWSIFSRRHGVIHEIGAGRRDREKTYNAPTSSADTLWYTGLVGRTFFDTPDGLREFAYIPSDLLTILPESINTNKKSHGMSVSIPKESNIFMASDNILDHACSLLAMLRKKSNQPIYQDIHFLEEIDGFESTCFSEPIVNHFLMCLFREINLLDSSNQPIPENIQLFLESPRGVGLAQLSKAWLKSKFINELRMIPGLVCEGEWTNNPEKTRSNIINYLKCIPLETWWSLPSFIQSIKDHNPDFQRPVGDYDSWFIKNSKTGEFLRGYEHWNDVDGRLVRFIIEGPLYWLGIAHLADHPVNAFKLSVWATSLLAGESPGNLGKEDGKLIIRSDGQIYIPRLAPRSIRYQVARFCTWIRLKDQVYIYQITPASLSIAENQGIQPAKILSMLAKHTNVIPPILVKAIHNWEKLGSAARVETAVILRTRTPEILQLIKKSRASRYLGDPLGPTTIILKSGSQEIVLKILSELGYLGEIVQ